MAVARKILELLRRRFPDRRGVSSAEYAILAVGIVIVVGSALLAFDLSNPMNYAASAITSGQSSIVAAR